MISPSFYLWLQSDDLRRGAPNDVRARQLLWIIQYITDHRLANACCWIYIFTEHFQSSLTAGKSNMPIRSVCWLCRWNHCRLEFEHWPREKWKPLFESRRPGLRGKKNLLLSISHILFLNSGSLFCNPYILQTVFLMWVVLCFNTLKRISCFCQYSMFRYSVPTHKMSFSSTHGRADFWHVVFKSRLLRLSVFSNI